ncbi:hypothetical protein QLG25_12690 [Pseudomonas sp. CBR-F]
MHRQSLFAVAYLQATALQCLVHRLQAAQIAADGGTALALHPLLIERNHHPGLPGDIQQHRIKRAASDIEGEHLAGHFLGHHRCRAHSHRQRRRQRQPW